MVIAIYEIEAIDIIHITVSVIIDSVIRDFTGIYPHIRREVLVVIHYALIDNRHNDIRRTCAECPGLPYVGIGAYEARLSHHKPRIVVMPLPVAGIRTLIKRETLLPRHCGRREYRTAGVPGTDCPAIVHTQLRRILYELHAAAVPELFYYL